MTVMNKKLMINQRLLIYKFKLDYITKLPGGTWKESAKDIQIKNGIISALLKDKKGVYNHDFIILNTDNCLKNNDGKFEVVICQIKNSNN